MNYCVVYLILNSMYDCTYLMLKYKLLFISLDVMVVEMVVAVVEVEVVVRRVRRRSGFLSLSLVD